MQPEWISLQFLLKLYEMIPDGFQAKHIISV